MYNKFPGKDITEEDIKSKIPLVANFSKEPFEIAGVVLFSKLMFDINYFSFV